MHKTSKPPQNQHIVPRFYLENFCRLSPGRRNPTLWVYEKDKPIRPSSATHEAKERYFYTVQRDGLIDYRFEHFLGWIEGLIAPILNKFNDPQYLFKRHEKETIAFFIALMFARVRPYREYVQKSLGKKMEETIKNHAKNKELLHAQVKELEAKIGKSIDIESFRKNILSDNFRIGPSKSFNLIMVTDTIRNIGRFLTSKPWSILRSDREMLFVTSDNPVCTVLPNDKGGASIGIGFGHKDMQVVFTVSPDVCLVIGGWSKDCHALIDTSGVRYYNNLIMRCSHKNVYAAKRSECLNQVFQQIGCTVIYGKNAFLPKRR